MAYEIPTCEPTQAHAGSSWQWDISYPDFPASESWQLSYYLRGPIDKNFAWGTEVTAVGDVFEVRIPATATDDLTTAGPYRLIGRVSKAGEVHVVYNERLLVLPDPSVAVNAKSFNRRMLEAIQASMLTDATATGGRLIQITVDGHSHTFADAQARDKALANYELLVALEENPHGSLTHAAEFVRG